MSDINLLPTDLRSREEEERKVPSPLPPRPTFTPASTTQTPTTPAKSETSTIKTPPPVSANRAVFSKPSVKPAEVKISDKLSWWQIFKLWLATPPGTRVGEAMNSGNHSGDKSISKFPARVQAANVPLGVLLDVNLLPVDVKSKQGVKRLGLRLVGVAVLAVIAVGAVYAGLSNLALKKEQELAKIRAEADDLQLAIAEFGPTVKNLQQVGRRMKVVESVFNQRNDWLKFFDGLEKLGVPGVSFITASATSTGKVFLTAEGTSVAALARQLLAFQQATDVVSSVQMSSVAGGEPAEKDQLVLYSTSFDLELNNNFLAKVPSVKPNDKSKSGNK